VSVAAHDARRADAESALPRRGRERGRPSGVAENELDVDGRSPIDLGDLGNRYALSYQSADARKLGARNLARRLRLELDRGLNRLAPRRRRPFQDAL
jgi:hypothetical protein